MLSAAHHVTSHRFQHTPWAQKCDYCKMADSRFEKSLDVLESSEEREMLSDETLAKYPQEVTLFAFVNQSKSNKVRNYSLLSFRRHVVFF